jgi:hypothetical protein
MEKVALPARWITPFVLMIGNCSVQAQILPSIEASPLAIYFQEDIPQYNTALSLQSQAVKRFQEIYKNCETVRKTPPPLNIDRIPLLKKCDADLKANSEEQSAATQTLDILLLRFALVISTVEDACNRPLIAEKLQEAVVEIERIKRMDSGDLGYLTSIGEVRDRVKADLVSGRLTLDCSAMAVPDQKIADLLYTREHWLSRLLGLSPK